MTRNTSPSSARNAPQKDADFDDLLGQLVDELAMTPVELEPAAPATQAQPDQGAAVPATSRPVTQAVPAASGGKTVMITAIVAGAVVAISVAAMAILIPRGEAVAPAKASLASVVDTNSAPDLIAVAAPIPPPEIAVKVAAPEAKADEKKPRPRPRRPRRPKPKPKPSVGFDDL